MFNNISDFWRYELKEVVDQLEKQPALAVSVLLPIMRERRAIRRNARCIRHGVNCFLKCAKSHTAGSSCTAYSRQGLKQGLADPTVIHLLAWLALRREVQEPEVTLENVSDFPTQFLLDFMADVYYVEPVVLDPRDYGRLCWQKQC